MSEFYSDISFLIYNISNANANNESFDEIKTELDNLNHRLSSNRSDI